MHGLASVKFFAAVWAFAKFDGGNNVCLSVDIARDATADALDAFASTGGAGANVEHGYYSARLALIRK